MENKSFVPYVYRVTNKITGQFYIGMKATGKSNGSEIGVDYFTSSSNKEFKEDFKNNPEKYLCEKLFEGSVKEVAEKEGNLIKQEKSNPLILNRALWTNGKLHINPECHSSQETRRKLSESLKGRKAPNKGVHMNEEQLRLHRERMKIAMNGGETKRRCSESHKGKPGNRKGQEVSVETRRKISQTLLEQHLVSPRKGVKLSEESKKKISESVKKTFTVERRKFQSELHKGKPNWAKGTHKSEAIKKKLSEAFLGRKWFTNGAECKQLYECPEGWWPGRIYKRKEIEKGAKL